MPDPVEFVCTTIGHEDLPAATLGTFMGDNGEVVYDVSYCRECADLMTADGQYKVRQTLTETVEGYFQIRRDQVGTHSPECWKSHPDCAYWAGREAAARATESLVIDLGRGDPYTEAIRDAAAAARANGAPSQETAGADDA